MEVSSSVSHFKSFADYSSLTDINAEMEFIKNDNIASELKAEIMERYLRKRCPTSLVGMDRFMDQVWSLRRPLSVQSQRSSTTNSGLSGRSPTSSRVGHPSRSIPHSSFSGFKISPMFKIDMVERELDESRIVMDKLRRRFTSARFMLETEEENMRMDISVIADAKTAFDNFVKQNSDKKTGRVIYDRFLRYIETELQNGDRELRRMKLKTKAAQTEYNRLIARVEQRAELAQQLHAIDFDKLIIENEELQEKFEHKTRKMMELKKEIGKKGQSVVSTKSKLNDILLSIGSLHQDIKQKEAKYKTTGQREIKNVSELITAEVTNQNMKKLDTTVKCPDTHSYMVLLMTLKDLQSEKEVWERRCKNQKQSINLLEHQLRQMSPSRKSQLSYRNVQRSLVSSKSNDSLRRYASMRPMPHSTPTGVL